MSDCRQCADFEWCAEHEDCGLFKPKPQTNADRIRSMTDEELAEWLDGGFRDADWCDISKFSNYDCMEVPCFGCIIDWLKQEVKE